MKLISLFTGAGGLDLGFEAAGFETSVAVELDGDAADTLRRNRHWPVFQTDIHTLPSTEILAAAELGAGDADLLIGGPPCQPFSKSGYWARGDARRLDDPRASTLEEYLRVLRDTRPTAFLLENVPGLAYRNKDEGLSLLRATIASINRETGCNYSFSAHLVNTAEYGIPQERMRVFIVGHRDGLPFHMPRPTHRLPPKGEAGEEQLVLDEREPWRTAWDAIGNLEDDRSPSLRVRGKWADLLPSIPEGSNYLFHTDRGDGMPLFGWRRRYWSFLLKLAKRLPSWTITAQPGSAIGPFHWKNRRLSAEELCRLQTFPRNYQVTGTPHAVQRQLGNAVPSAMAELLGWQIRHQFFGHPLPPTTATLLPERREHAAEPEEIAPVPRKYWSLAGTHAPHPGTGKGRGALARAAAGD